MPYVRIPKDLAKIKTKVAFNLTKRQLICFGLAGAIGIPTYLLTRNVFGSTGAVMCLLVTSMPCFFFAMYEKNGQPFEKVIKNFIIYKFKKPDIRPYRTDNLYSAIEKQIELEKEVERIVGSEIKNPSSKRQATVPKTKKAVSGSGKKGKNAR